MTNDPTIREQTYRYFLQEAPELLSVLEQEMLSLREDYSINKVNNLMRVTHTLKGAAASVGLETIKTVAHSLEDIFKALFNPDVTIDPEVEALLFEGYECLRLPIAAEVTGRQANDAEILDRTATVFARLQEKLGDCFGQETHLPNSVELGFDLTQSIFEVGVNQRLDDLAAVLASASPQDVATQLRTQAEIFQGLAESLNLQGFGAIAQATIAALDAYPDQAVTIAQAALADFRAGQAAVLNGDRTQGGQPSVTLQQLSGLPISSTDLSEGEIDPRLNEQTQGEFPFIPLPPGLEDEPAASLEESVAGDYPQIQTPVSQTDRRAELIAAESELILGELQDSESLLSELPQQEPVASLLEAIWGGETALASQPSTPVDRSPTDAIAATSLHQEQQPPINSTARFSTSAVSDPVNGSSDEPEVTVETASSQQRRTERSSRSQTEQVSMSQTVRVNVEHLEYLNYAIGELLTNQNRQSLQNEQLQTVVRSLLTRIQQHQHQLDQLQDWSDRQFNRSEQRRTSHRLKVSQFQAQGLSGDEAPFNLPFFNHQSSTPFDRFDSLELDRYSESQLLVQSILEDAVQLTEVAEAIDLFTTQSNQTLEKQRRLLTSTRDTLMEARMLPLGELFGRFSRILQQLEVLHNKQAVLELRGTEVLVDKVVVEKLYGPLLHLVRNAFAHGIESPSVRQQWGKSPKGLIEICAYYQGRFLIIEVRDDGQGLDFEHIRQRAVECHLVSPERASSLNQAQLTNLLFEPGFSTTAEVNDLSGRGVGLDMVRAQLQALQGSVKVNSKPHQGTTFALRIPLNLTIAKLLLCQTGDCMYALLPDAIEQILIPQADQIRSWDGGKALRWSNGDLEQLVSVHRLAEVLDYVSTRPKPFVSQRQLSLVSSGPTHPIILIRHQDKLLGLEVDQLLGEQELVIRPLGSMIVPPNYVYGGSILADGRLTLVIDGAVLIQHIVDQQSSSITVSDRLPPLLSFSQEQRQLPAQIRAALPASPPSNVRSLSPQRVLIVDDSITVRQTLVLTLQKAGYQVLQAKDGWEALEQLRQQDIQLVICDIEMPRMNGFEFLKYHQQDSALADIPVVILTSRSGEKHRLIAAELGAIDYITKPFLEHKLLATVKDVLETTMQNSVPK